jgi:ADP-ribose pyrophosphatase YjhB (NUDIX family)
MSVEEAIEILSGAISDPRVGLPREIFLFVSRTTPMVNVDLLIKDEGGRTLLAWRDDELAGAGWHVPGGIVRFKERLEARVREVSLGEIGRALDFEEVPVAINEVICDHDTRGHFISFLYACSAPSSFVPPNAGLSEGDPGYLLWHDTCPANLVKVHEMYRRYI